MIDFGHDRTVGIMNDRSLHLGSGVHCVLLTILLTGQAASQELLRQSLIDEQDTSKATSLGFERALNTFLWNGRVVYEQSLRGVDIRLRQRVRSRLIRTEQRSIQDEYATNLDLTAPLNKIWSLSSRLLSTGLSDNRAIDLSKLAQHQALVGLRVQPSEQIQINALGGYQFDSQETEQDHGFSYLAEVEGKDVSLEEFRATFRSRWAQAFLTPRRPSQGMVDLRLDRDFGVLARNSLVFSYNRLRREFYTPAEQAIRDLYEVRSNLFQREAEAIEVSDQLDYQAAERSRLIVRGGIQSRTIDRGFRYKNFSNPANVVLDTRIQEFHLTGSIGLTSQVTNWLDTDLTLAYHEREERHQVLEEQGTPFLVLERQRRSERRLENVSRRTSLSSQLGIRLSESDRLTFVGTASILRYDTPDTLNVDDRDELLLTFGLQESHRLNPQLTFSITLDATLSHLVYLSRFQSANNTWNRILRLSPKVEYVPSPWFRTTNIAEVLVNYTVYDFEEQVALVRSFSFRQASWIDSTSLRLSNRIGLDFVGGVRVYERGILRWKEFKERPQNFFIEQSYWPRLMWADGSDVRVGIGFRYFSQDRFRSDGADRELERRLVSSGPTVEVEWRQSGFQRVSIVGWRESQSQDGVEVRSISNLSVKLFLAL